MVQRFQCFPGSTEINKLNYNNSLAVESEYPSIDHTEEAEQQSTGPIKDVDRTRENLLPSTRKWANRRRPAGTGSVLQSQQANLAIENLASAKLDLVNKQSAFATEEHNLKMLVLREKLLYYQHLNKIED